MAINDQRSAKDRGRDDDARWMRDQPHGQRERPRGDDGAERNVPGPGGHHHEHHQRGGQRQRRGAEIRADERGHRLAAAKAQKHRIRMPDHDGQRGGAHPLDVPARELAFQPHGQVAFAHIQQQSGYARRAAGSAQDVGGPNVAAAGGAHVAAGGQFHQQISEGDVTQQVSDRES